jgi:hypothetical protein
MAGRYPRRAIVPEYKALHITSTGTAVPVGRCVSTTSAAALTAGSNVTVTPASMVNIMAGMYLNFTDGTHNENAQVLTVSASSFTVNLQNSYAGGVQIISRTGTSFGGLIINNPGTGVTFTFYDGHPSLAPDAGQIIAVLAISSSTPDKFYGLTCDKGLFYTASGTMGDFTLRYLDEAF